MGALTALLVAAALHPEPAAAAPGETIAALAPAAPVAIGDSDIAARLQASTLQVAGEPVRAALLRRFYELHGFAPVWPSRQAAAAALWAAVQRSGEHGLDPNSFHARLLGGAVALTPNDRDLLLSDAFLGYADALAHGGMAFSSRYDDEDLSPTPIDVGATLANATAAPDPVKAIEALAPNTPAYSVLRQARLRYLAIAAAGGWPQVSSGSPAALAQRLAIEGYTEPGAEALRAFQRAHGLSADGKLGTTTVAELNVGADERARQIAVNLERLRWLPRAMPPDRVVVNAASAQLHLFRAGVPVFATRVVVGQADKQTPEFQAAIESVLFNPPWNVPLSIANSEILPKLAADPEYLERHHMVRRRGGGIQQLPGAGTALGQLKFEMPNRFDVYLHDTPNKNLFSRDNRNQSHGCVRVQNPRELAALLLQDNAEGIARSVAVGGTHRRALPQPVPVFITYQTAFLDDTGRVAFRRDVYQRDEEVWRALLHLPQAPLAEQIPSSQRGG
jgi:murein L,D-transpeptidase YcbB/YkuD